MNRRRLYRCRHDQRLAGVAGGVAEYFDLDPSLVRIVWAVSVFFGGLTLLLYIVMAIVVPLEPATMPPAGPWQPGSESWAAPVGAAPTGEPGATEPGTGEPAAGDSGASGQPPAQYAWQPAQALEPRNRGGSGAVFFGLILILFGTLALADQLLPAWNYHDRLWPAFILGVGVLLVIRSFRSRSEQP